MKPVSKTAYYCCGVRMLDAESKTPVIGDHYARLFMDEEGLAIWEKFKKYRKPHGGNQARCYLIDQLLRKRLEENPQENIILIGAGFDSRAYRLKGGNWIEIDEEAIIERKNAKLPITDCPNPLQRHSIDFAQEKLIDKLVAFKDLSPVTFVVEGVLLYLEKSQKIDLIQAMQHNFPQHTLICDLITKKFFNIFGGRIHKQLVVQGASFTDLSDNPQDLFLHHQYQLEETTSIGLTSAKMGLVNLPVFIPKLLNRFKIGYSVATFLYHQKQ